LREASWPEAIAAAAAGLKGKRTGVLVGGRVTVEDAYAYSKFARIALGTNDVDFRSRPHSEEERAFLAAHVAGSRVRYSDIDTADHVVLVGFEPEEESPIVFLRIRKQVRIRDLPVTAISPWNTRGFKKLQAKFIGVAPGAESAALAELPLTNQSVIVVGERLCESVGGLSAVAALAAKSGAKIAWVPRRAGERGALEAGAIGNLLPGGRPVSDAAARVDVAAAWTVESLPTSVGLDSKEILTAAAQGEIQALVIGGVDPFDMHKPDLAGLDSAFVLSLEIRPSAITERADVVIPVASVVEKSGSFMSWEGRTRSFEQSVPESPHQSDLYILSLIADSLEKPLGFSTVRGAAREFGTLANWYGARAPFASTSAATLSQGTLLASWRQLLDNGSLQINEPNLSGTARKAVARVNAKFAQSLGVIDGDLLTISTDHGALSLNVEISDVVDNVVWLPRNAVASQSLRMLGVLNGAEVKVRKGL
jgi:NADH-quinone oxidoreductase subunit G